MLQLLTLFAVVTTGAPLPPPIVAPAVPNALGGTVFMQPTIDFPPDGELRAQEIDFIGNRATIVAPMDDVALKLRTAALFNRTYQMVSVNTGQRTFMLADVNIVSFDAESATAAGPMMTMVVRFSSGSLPL